MFKLFCRFCRRDCPYFSGQSLSKFGSLCGQGLRYSLLWTRAFGLRCCFFFISFFACFTYLLSFYFLQVFSVPLPRFSCLVAFAICFFLRPELLMFIVLGKCIWFVTLLLFLFCFWRVTILVDFHFFFPITYIEKHFLCTHLELFYLVFLCPRAPASNHTHTNPPLPICTLFFFIFGKTHTTSWSGKFPRP